jgi:hypothetical protein
VAEERDGLAELVANLSEITEDDIFWLSRKELELIANGLKRGK